MGIPKLYDFIKGNCREIEARSSVGLELHGPLVIDGNQLCHQLYGFWGQNVNILGLRDLNSDDGGKYPEYYHRAHSFFDKLKQSRIEAHMVFDGVDKNEKLTEKYIKKRCLEKHIPPLLYTVMYNVLREKNIHVHVGDGEGDELCAQIANHFKCPVLSFDTDFFLLDIAEGYIPLQHFKWQESPVKVERIYKRDTIFSTSDPSSNDMWFLVATIWKMIDDLKTVMRAQLGIRGIRNEKSLFWQYISSRIIHRGVTVDSFKRNNISDRRMREKFGVEFDKIKKYYNDTAPCDPNELLRTPLSICRELPPSFLEAYRKRTIPFSISDAKINKRQFHSNSIISLHIRQCCYSVLGVEQVREYHVKGGSVEAVMVPQCAQLVTPFKLDEIPQVPQEERQTFIFSEAVLNCARFPKLPQDTGITYGEKLFLSSIVFWIRYSEQKTIPVYISKVLLACFLLLNTKPESIRQNYGKHMAHSCRDTNSIYEWQYIYTDIVALNKLLQCPPALCPSKVYDGTTVMSLASNGDKNIDSVIRALEIPMEKYRMLLDIVAHTCEMEI